MLKICAFGRTDGNSPGGLKIGGPVCCQIGHVELIAHQSIPGGFCMSVSPVIGYTEVQTGRGILFAVAGH